MNTNKKLLLRIGLLLPLFITLSVFASNKCFKSVAAQISAEVDRTAKRIVSDNFNTQRNLQAYFKYCPGLRDHLLSLRGNGYHWIDMGAGEARAMLDYNYPGKFASSKENLIKTTAVVANPLPSNLRSVPDNKIYQQMKELEAKILNPNGSYKLTAAYGHVSTSPTGEQILAKPTEDYFKHRGLILRYMETQNDFRLLDGRLLEDIPEKEIGKADIITDVFGPLSYTSDLHGTLVREFAQLKKGGTLYLTITSTTIEDDPLHGTVSLFFDKIKGVEQTLNYKDEVYSFALKKISDTVEVPKLKLIDFVDRTPPIRTFRIIP